MFLELPLVNQNSNEFVREHDLIASFAPEEIHNRLEKMLGKTRGYEGVYSLGHEEFLNSANGLSTIVDHLHKANLFFLYGIHGKTTILESDNEAVFAVEACDILIDKNQTSEQMLKYLVALEDLAKAKGKAIGVIRFNSQNIEALREWLKTLQNKDIKIVPIKALPKKIKVSG